MNSTTAKPTPETIELEAHAIYKNIGLTPRQLADQRAELIAALERAESRFNDIRMGYQRGGLTCSECADEGLQDIRSARAKAVPK